MAQAQSSDVPSLEDLLRTERKGAAADMAVSTASRQAQSSDLTPAVTRVVTRQDIERYGVRSFGDALRLIPGLDIFQDTQFTRVAVRGISPGDFNGRVLFLLDGLRLNENIYDAGQIDREFMVDMSLVDRIEFTPGPGSALYGGNALLGVVNVVTQRADTLAGPQARLAISPKGQRASRLSYGQRLESGAEWLLAFSSEDEPRPPFIFPVEPDDAARRAPFRWDRARRWLASFRGDGLSLSAGMVDRQRGLSALLPVSHGVAGGLDQVKEHFVHGAWDGRLAEWDVHLALAWQGSRYRSDTPDDHEPALRIERFEAIGRWWLGEARASRSWGGEQAGQHTTSFGLDGQRDTAQRFRDGLLGETANVDDASGKRLGLFVQDEWRLAERQRLVLGLRRDLQSRNPARLSPRAAWVWSPEPGQSVKLLWGSAFRPPNRFERVEGPNAPPPPAAERLHTTELAWEGPLRASDVLPGTWKGQVSLFSTRAVNLIRIGEVWYENAPALNSRGVELTFTGQGASGWQVQLALTGQRNRDATGARQGYSPSELAKWAVQLPLAGPSLRLSFSGWASTARDGDVPLGGYAQTQAQLLWQPHRRWEAFLGVQNLDGRTYREASSDIGEPRLLSGRRWQAGWVWRGEGL